MLVVRRVGVSKWWGRKVFGIGTMSREGGRHSVTPQCARTCPAGYSRVILLLRAISCVRHSLITRNKLIIVIWKRRPLQWFNRYSSGPSDEHKRTVKPDVFSSTTIAVVRLGYTIDIVACALYCILSSTGSAYNTQSNCDLYYVRNKRKRKVCVQFDFSTTYSDTFIVKHHTNAKSSLDNSFFFFFLSWVFSVLHLILKLPYVRRPAPGPRVSETVRFCPRTRTWCRRRVDRSALPTLIHPAQCP